MTEKLSVAQQAIQRKLYETQISTALALGPLAVVSLDMEGYTEYYVVEPLDDAEGYAHFSSLDRGEAEAVAAALNRYYAEVG